MKSIKVSGVLLYLFGFSLVLLLYVNYIFLPLNQKVADLNGEHLNNLEQLQTYELQSARSSDLRQKTDGLKTQLNEEKADPAVTGKNVAEDIGKIVGSSGVALKSINVGPEQAEKGKTAASGKQLSTVSVELNVLCTQTQLPALIGSFENGSEGVYFVNRVKYEGPDDAGKVDAVLTMTLYYFSGGAKQ
ncbi:GspMb/PilO family protein [Caproiciproducens sp.]